MSKFLYPIFNLPNENDVENEPIPIWIKWWFYKKTSNCNLAWNGWAEDFISRIAHSTQAKIEVKDNRNCIFYSPRAGYGDYENKYLFKPLQGFKENTQYLFSLDNYTTAKSVSLLVEYTDGSTSSFPNVTPKTWTNIRLTSDVGKTIKYLRCEWIGGNSYIDIDSFIVKQV